MSWPSCIKLSLLSVVTVLSLNYRPNSVQIDSDIRANQLIKPWIVSMGWLCSPLALFPLAKVGRPVGLCRKWAYGRSASDLGIGCSSPGCTSGLHTSLRSGRRSRAHLAWVMGGVQLGGACAPLPSS